MAKIKRYAWFNMEFYCMYTFVERNTLFSYAINSTNRRKQIRSDNDNDTDRVREKKEEKSL